MVLARVRVAVFVAALVFVLVVLMSALQWTSGTDSEASGDIDDVDELVIDELLEPEPE
jgi:hypothetical protein